MAKLIGLCRVTQDAEIRFTADGTPVANINLAYSYGRKRDGDKYAPSQFVSASLWGKRAESLSPYLTKGTAIVAYLSEVHIRTFDKQDGSQGHALKARLDDMDFVPGQQRQQQSPQPAQQQPAPQQNPGYSFQQPQQDSSQTQGGPVDDLDDDIPW